jgi:hypothetical protein
MPIGCAPTNSQNCIQLKSSNIRVIMDFVLNENQNYFQLRTYVCN